LWRELQPQSAVCLERRLVHGDPRMAATRVCLQAGVHLRPDAQAGRRCESERGADKTGLRIEIRRAPVGSRSDERRTWGEIELPSSGQREGLMAVVQPE